jgi:NAD-dependent dihydropyrimidine dehydrogenase PreA subunit
MKRKIISIDDQKCTGCGLCTNGCPEGAIKIINGKAKLVGDILCDGLGACIGRCPENAISIEEREAESYNEIKVLENIISQGKEVVEAHLQHLDEHNEKDYLKEALNYLNRNNFKVNFTPENSVTEKPAHHQGGCPGSRAFSFEKNETDEAGERQSHLTHWPVQLHLISPASPHYKGSDLLIAADCTAFTVGDFHRDFLMGKTLAIACPKLDEGLEVYVEKITALIDEAKVNTITVMVMQVPCCGGLVRLVQQAALKAKRKVPVKYLVLSIRGEVLTEEMV